MKKRSRELIEGRFRGQRRKSRETDHRGRGRTRTVQLARVWHRKLAYRDALTEAGKAEDGKMGFGTEDQHDLWDAVRTEFCLQEGGRVEEASGVRKTSQKFMP